MLTETEIFDYMQENFRLAAENARRLGSGERGPLYVHLRNNLRRVEGCCRQAAFWRGDARWLVIGAIAARAAAEAGDWVRARQWLRFGKLAALLENGVKASKDLRDKATHRSGLILPKPMAGPIRENRPVQVILPAGFQRVH